MTDTRSDPIYAEVKSKFLEVERKVQVIIKCSLNNPNERIKSMSQAVFNLDFLIE